jgi:hypothetical protein
MNPNPNVQDGADANQRNDRSDDSRWFWLTAFQYLLIAAVTGIFVWKIVSGLDDLSDLKDMDTARGLITFVITLGTVAIAVMLALTAVVVRDFDRRIVVGREVLTVLVGVLGTIVGFYYGAASNNNRSSTAAQQISVAAPQITSINGSATLTSKIEGGSAPYQYAISFSNTTIPAIEQNSPDGSIKAEFKLADQALTELSVTIEGKDKTGVAFAFNKDGSIKTPVQRSSGNQK